MARTAAVPPAPPFAPATPDAAAPAGHDTPARAIPSLDGLRALSIAGVLASHWAMHAGAGLDRVGPYLGPLGTTGVRVFFVISGYLITTLLLRDVAANGAVRLGRFYFRRLLRIFPPYYAYLGAIAALSAAGVLPALGGMWRAWAYVSNLALPQNWFTGHTWSLSVEEQFYLAWPVVLMLLGRRRATAVAVGACLVMPAVRLLARVYYRDQWMAGSFAFDFLAGGCLLALAPTWLARPKAWVVARGGLLVAALLVAASLAEDVFCYRPGLRSELVELVGLPGLELAAITAAVAWCVANPTSRVGRVLNAAPLRAVGIGSYSIYLWQQPFFSPRLPAYGVVGALGATAAMAAASYWLVERPSLAARDRIERWWRDRSAARFLEPVPHRSAA